MGALPTPSAKYQPLTKGVPMKPVIRYRSQLLYRKSYKPIRNNHIRLSNGATLTVRTVKTGPQKHNYEYATD